MSPRSKRLSLFLLCDLLLLGVAYIFRGPILTELANLWIQDNGRIKADAIVVLGGGIRDRPLAAAQLFHDGYAPQIIVMRPGVPSVRKNESVYSEAETARDLLLANGVPDTAITFVGDGVANTFEESQAVKEWAISSRAKSILIPTELFHTRRVRWIFRKTLKDIGVQVRVVDIQTRDYEPSNWWRKEAGLIAFQNEVLKYAFYRFRY